MSVSSRNFVSESWPSPRMRKPAESASRRVSFPDDRRGQRMKTGLAVAPQIANRRHHERKQRRQQLLQIIADKKIFLTRLADDRRRIDRVFAMKNRVGSENRIIVLQRIITVMIAERAFGPSLVRRDVAADRKFRFGDQAMTIGPERIRGRLDLSRRPEAKQASAPARLRAAARPPTASSPAARRGKP